MDNKTKYKNIINDYEDTIFAILGFMNFYRYDDATKSMRNDVKVFQGRHLKRLEQLENKEDQSEKDKSKKHSFIEHTITPDISIVYNGNIGVIGEVKKSFCNDSDKWIDDFKQLMLYDGNIISWPTVDGKISSCELVLLLHYSRAVRVRDYYLSKKGSGIKFICPFSIIEFQHTEEGNHYFSFRLVEGQLQDESIHKKLHDGVEVPMEIFSNIYSQIALYDSEPPIPYLLDIAWRYVVTQIAMQDERFPSLFKNHKLEVVVDIDAVLDILSESFSFKQLHGSDIENQPVIPKREWIIRAFDALCKAGEAKWLDNTNQRVSIIFRKYDDPLEKFIEICAKYCNEIEDEIQVELFEDQ